VTRDARRALALALRCIGLVAMACYGGGLCVREYRATEAKVTAKYEVAEVLDDMPAWARKP
jgi:hypothetical protein